MCIGLQVETWFAAIGGTVRTRKRRIKSIGVEFRSDMDDEAKRAAVTIAAAELQAFYDNNHNLQNNMPGPKQDRESDDGGSAESAHGEPVQKASKTD